MPKRQSKCRTVGLAILAMLILWPDWHAPQAQPRPVLDLVGSRSVARTGSGNTAQDRFQLKKPKANARLDEITFIGEAQQRLKLTDFRGRYVLLNIWATWCAPCLAEMPALDRLQEKLGSADFQIIALSIDNKPIAQLRAYYERVKIKNLPLYIDTTGAALRKLRSYGMPTTLLIDKNGREIGRITGAVAWDDPAVVAAIQRIFSSKE